MTERSGRIEVPKREHPASAGPLIYIRGSDRQRYLSRGVTFAGLVDGVGVEGRGMDVEYT